MFMMSIRTLAFATAALVCASTGVWAQGQTRYPVQSLNFDLWCQETAKLPVARCLQRTPEDMQRFEAYRAVIERYEIPFLQEREGRVQINRTIINGDPAGDPVSRNPQAQTQQPRSAATPETPGQ